MIVVRIREGMSFLRTLTPARAINYWLLQWSYALSRLTGSPVLLGYPAFIHIEPTNDCNLHCPECPAGAGLLTRQKGRITLEDYCNLLGKVASKACYLSLYFQGEPFLHRNFIEMIRKAKKRNLFVVTSTNAQLITEALAEQAVLSGLDRIIISFDGPDAASYDTYRKGGKWENVVLAVKYLNKAKEKFYRPLPVIILQCLLLKANEGKKAEIRGLARQLGADLLEFKTIQLLDCSVPSALLPSNSRDSRYQWSEGKGYMKKKQTNKVCRRIFNSCVITWDGEVAPCCYDKDAEFSYGNIKKHTLKNIWEGKARRDFVNRLSLGKEKILICRNCDE